MINWLNCTLHYTATYRSYVKLCISLFFFYSLSFVSGNASFFMCLWKFVYLCYYTRGNGVNFWDFDMFIYLKWDMGLGKYWLENILLGLVDIMIYPLYTFHTQYRSGNNNEGTLLYVRSTDELVIISRLHTDKKKSIFIMNWGK